MTVEESRPSVGSIIMSGNPTRMNSMDVPDSIVGSNLQKSTIMGQHISSASSAVRSTGDGELTTVTMTKTSPDQSWGFSMNVLRNHLVITKIARGGLADQYAKQLLLQVGDVIESIDDQHCTTTEEACDMLRGKATITIRAKTPTLAQRTFVETNLKKSSKNESWGFGIGRAPDGQSLMVKKTVPKGIAVTQSNLRPGYEIVSIDGVNTRYGMSIPEAGRRLKKSEISIRARAPIRPSGQVITATVQKETQETPLGLGFQTTNDGHLQIDTIQHDSPAYHTQLEPGLILETINDGAIHSQQSEAEVAQMLADAPKGTVSISARVP